MRAFHAAVVGAALCILGAAAVAEGTFADAWTDASAKFKARKYEEARDAFAKAAGTATNGIERASALHQVGYLSFRVRKYEDALAAYGKVVEIKDAKPEQLAQGQYEIGRCLYYLKKYPEAEAALSKVAAIEGAPQSTRDRAMSRIGRCHLYGRRDYDKAIAVFETLAKDAETRPSMKADALVSLARALGAKKEYARSEKVCRDVIAMPKAPFGFRQAAQSQLGDTLMMQGKAEEAAAAYQVIVDGPKYAHYYKSRSMCQIGQAHLNAKQYGKAEAAFKAALASKVTRPEHKKLAKRRLQEIERVRARETKPQ